MRKLTVFAAFMAGMMLLSACSQTTPTITTAENLVENARWTVETFKNSDEPYLHLFHDQLPNAQGIMIFPGALKAGFIIGAEYGNGVLLARTAAGDWSQPAFYTMGAGSIGLQIGGQVSQVVLVIRSRKALEAVVKHQGKFGADIGVTVGTIGAGLEGSTTTNVGADIVAFSDSAGLYAGGTVEGAVLARRNDYNQAYYGTGALPDTILFGQGFSNPDADALRASLKP